MKFTLAWLKDHLETDASLEEIGEKLTSLGLEVKDITDPTEALSAFTIAEVVKAEPHPNADRLTVCHVETGKGVVQVICGAPNARAGMKGVFAPAGSYIPGTGLDLKSAKIRGVESNGMLCSERELMISDDHEGIIDLPADAPVGVSFAEYSGLDDPVIDIDISPNRQDCLGVAGIARDLAAAGLGKVVTKAPTALSGDFASPVAITLEFDAKHKDACPLFVGRYFRNVTNAESPEWLQQRLRAIGLRPINALVDITNYITHDRGRPLHVYDADKLEGNVLARMAEAGEKMDALDGKSYELSAEDCVIADEGRVIDIGGIMGGETTGCTGETQNVLLEAAYFDPLRIAATGRRLQILSDARYRFERGVDPAFVEPGAELASRMILDLCGGEASELVVAGAVPDWKRNVDFRVSRVEQLGGLAVKEKQAVAILESLGFGVEPAGDKGSYHVSVPSWRSDIDGEADLVEEVLRITGYDKIPTAYLPRESAVAGAVLTRRQRQSRAVRRRLAADGLNECVCYSFIRPADAALFANGEEIRIENPISSELSIMRPSILPSLLAATQRNLDRGAKGMGLFEIAPAYETQLPDGERFVAAGIRAGELSPRHWAGGRRQPDLFDAKADALAALRAAGAPVDKLTESTDAPAWYHPGRSACLRLGPKTILARFGELHPRVARKFELSVPVVAFEVFLDALPEGRDGKARTRVALDANELPLVERDFAFVTDRKVSAADLVGAVRSADKKHIQEVSVFDVYEGAEIGENERSIAVSVVLEPDQRTFTDEEIEAVSAKIIAAAAAKTGARLRG